MKPPPRTTLYENIQNLRTKPDTARVGFPYTRANNVEMMEDAEKGVSVEEIAKKQKRTVKAMRQRIAMHAARIMILYDVGLQAISEKYHVDIDLLDKEHQKLCFKERKIATLFREMCSTTP